MTANTQTPPADKAKKSSYRVTNWKEYDAALVKRGNITVWFDDEVIAEQWQAQASGKRGAPPVYSDVAIQTLLTLKAVFSLPYRGVEGFALSLVKLMNVDLPIPDHSHLSRRAKTLPVVISRRCSPEPLHIVVDSTGLKVYGEGEWKVRQHGVSKRRTWIKAHLAIDTKTRDSLAVEVTTANWADCEVFADLLEQIDGTIEQIDADGAYDTRDAYATAEKRQAKLIVPPRDNAVAWEADHPRTQALNEIAKHGLKQWKKSSKYHQRSLAENAMYRLKQLFGDSLASRLFETQVTEVQVRVAAMNTMSALGMPVSVRTGIVAS